MISTELRNQIYDSLLIHHDEYTGRIVESPHILRFKPPPFPIHLNKYCPGKEDFRWSTLWGATLGLTQTCRTIRHEFRPLHFSRFEIRLIDFRPVSRYVSDFFPPPMDSYGTCVLWEWDGEMNSYEMLPLIHTLSKSLNFSITVSGWDRDEKNVKALIDVKENRKWREYVGKNVTRISYFPDMRSCVRPRKNQLFVNIKHTVGEPWMIEEKKKGDERDERYWITKRTPNNKPECVRRWLEFVGLPHLDETLDDIGIQVAPEEEDSGDDSSNSEDS